MKWKCIRQIIYISRSTKRGKRIKVFWSKGGSEERKEKIYTTIRTSMEEKII